VVRAVHIFVFKFVTMETLEKWRPLFDKMFMSLNSKRFPSIVIAPV